jgi:Tfp pilus assembly protein PilV
MKRRTARRGLTLVEIMVGFFVLSLTVVCASALFPASAFLRERSGGYSRAAAIAQQKLDQIRRIPAEQLTYNGLVAAQMIDQGSGNQPFSFTSRDGLAQQLIQGSGTLTVEFVDRQPGPTNVAVGAGSPEMDLAIVRVAITWVDARSMRQRLETETEVASKAVWLRAP